MRAQARAFGDVLEVVPVMELIRMRGREIEGGDERPWPWRVSSRCRGDATPFLHRRACIAAQRFAPAIED